VEGGTSVHSHQCWPPTVAHKITTLLHNQRKFKKKTNKRQFSAFTANRKMHCIYNNTQDSKLRVTWPYLEYDRRRTLSLNSLVEYKMITTTLHCFSSPADESEDLTTLISKCQLSQMWHFKGTWL